MKVAWKVWLFPCCAGLRLEITERKWCHRLDERTFNANPAFLGHQVPNHGIELLVIEFALLALNFTEKNPKVQTPPQVFLECCPRPKEINTIFSRENRTSRSLTGA
uniref:Putative secreted peptide n=1 Tax=Anopheles braziliensis TaxID=58242 RepID=A0A2M3ZVU2_9DIPT